MSTATLQVERDGGVARVTLNRPEVKNALSPAMADELAATFRALAKDEAVRVVLLAGAGGNFCSGGDVKGMQQGGARSPEQRRAGMQRYRELATALLAIDKPVIAALDGVAYGAGFSIALAADLVLVSDRVRLAMVFHRIGLVPDVGAWYLLPRVVGLQRAKELIFSAREIGAAEALQFGVALEVHAPDALLTRANAIAASFCGAPPTAMSLSKRALQVSLQSELEAMLDLEAAGQAIAATSDYTAEALRRFAAKEAPQFRWPAKD
ncbi:enoyl-CoA hydratase/isomerase family protein [Piscinibacter koreensis]|uniref:Enoyl-CoA hydratase/isomerase family protein n=1 Tax=Piscinibacter koreensis TaxID=2742824 RepID=A0A7Y6NMY0_9BURK|nr:enoyl-CoA hydratase/isomerase family protein [Schlegelella koreensis]NUZ06130.1 enoyl-CoA hydratase/isomerase family protein [Schlegelella koreensis]